MFEVVAKTAAGRYPFNEELNKGTEEAIATGFLTRAEAGTWMRAQTHLSGVYLYVQRTK